jgi:hypothetical protein
MSTGMDRRQSGRTRSRICSTACAASGTCVSVACLLTDAGIEAHLRRRQQCRHFDESRQLAERPLDIDCHSRVSSDLPGLPLVRAVLPVPIPSLKPAPSGAVSLSWFALLDVMAHLQSFGVADAVDIGFGRRVGLGIDQTNWMPCSVPKAANPSLPEG